MWVARNPDGKYHLYESKPTYDSWYGCWLINPCYKGNDEQTIRYLETAYKEVSAQQLGFEMNWRDKPIEVDTLIKLKHPNKERKERTATERQLNKYIERHKFNDNLTGLHCDYFDDIGVTECNAPWSYMCKGNKFDCGKLKYKWLASLSDDVRDKWLEEHEGIYE